MKTRYLMTFLFAAHLIACVDEPPLEPTGGEPLAARGAAGIRIDHRSDPDEPSAFVAPGCRATLTSCDPQVCQARNCSDEDAYAACAALIRASCPVTWPPVTPE